MFKYHQLCSRLVARIKLRVVDAADMLGISPKSNPNLISIDFHTLLILCRTVIDFKEGSNMLVGLTLTVGALPALPVLYWAEAVVDYLGHSNILIMAFTFYCVRYTG